MSECFNPLCPHPHNLDLAEQCQGCGWPLALQGQYWAKQVLGQGGFGRTLLAVSGSLTEAHFCVNRQLWPARQQDGKARSLQWFAQAAERLATLGQHPQIPALLNHFEANGYCYFVQEWIEGTNLAILLTEQGVLSESQIWQLLNDALPVLQFIHSHQVIHRDVKPTNLIRRSSDGCLFLVDFGAATLVEESQWQQVGTSLGSPEYAAPEQAKGKATFASDLYSLGVTCIHLLTGIPPFELFDAVNDRWIWRSYLTQPVSDRLAQLLDKLIQNALSQRYQTAAEVITLVQAELRSRSWITATPSVAAPVPTSNRLWQCQHTLTDPFRSMTSVNSLAFSPDGQWLASGSDDKTVRLWNLATRNPIQRLTDHNQAIQAVAFSPDSQWLASGSDDKTVRLWNLDGELIQRLSGHTRAVKSVAFSPNGQLLASGSWDKTIRLWDIATGTLIGTLAHELQVTAVAFSPLGNLLASASCDRTVRLWSAPDAQNSTWNLQSTLTGFDWPVFAIAFSPDGQLLATGGDDKTIKLWQIQTGQLLLTLDGHSWSISTLAFSPDSTTLASGSWDHRIKLWSVSSGQLLDTLTAHQDSVHSLTIHPLGTAIASGSKDKTIKLWQRVDA